ncbi:MAG TPA: response regulator [Bryobacteraceae bacterium]|nr:response regulator [Bryobacteraceae bacterium]
MTGETADDKIALVVDDNEVFRTRLSRAFANRGWRAESAAEGEGALKLAAVLSPDLAIVDLRLPGMGGLDIVRALRQLDDSIRIIVLTGYGSIATALSATRLGADHYLSKPADADEILAAYERIEMGSEPGAALDDTAVVPSLARVEWEHIQRVLAGVDGNISQAARLLGLHRRSLQRKLSKLPPQV